MQTVPGNGINVFTGDQRTGAPFHPANFLREGVATCPPTSVFFVPCPRRDAIFSSKQMLVYSTTLPLTFITATSVSASAIRPSAMSLSGAHRDQERPRGSQTRPTQSSLWQRAASASAVAQLARHACDATGSSLSGGGRSPNTISQERSSKLGFMVSGIPEGGASAQQVRARAAESPRNGAGCGCELGPLTQLVSEEGLRGGLAQVDAHADAPALRCVRDWRFRVEQYLA